MGRIYNLQRDPESREYFAIGKSDRPYSMGELNELEARAAQGDVLAIAALIDVDLGLDRFGEPLPPMIATAAQRRAFYRGWPPRASRLRGSPAWPPVGPHPRKARWERDRALRRTWQSEGFGRD